MTQIKPFQAVHYNPEKIKNISQVVCPPYDVISKEQQIRLHNASPYNFVHIDLGKDQPRDNDTDNRYTRAQKLYEDWIREGVLQQDQQPCIYFYKQEYRIVGQRYSRLGFIALMKLQEDGDAKIFPHENTHSAAKEDRFKLTSMLKSNLSPIFVVFSDKKKTAESIFAKHFEQQPPLFDVKDEDGVRHMMWRLDEPKYIREICDALEEQKFFIADGHHRYEVAQEYRKHRLKNRPKTDGSPFDYVMTYFTNMESKDLQIFPIHRVIKKMPKALDFLEEYFRIDKIKVRDDLAVLLAKSGKNECTYDLYMRDGIKLLRLKNKALIDQNIREGSKDYRHLDATILKHFIFDKLGITSDNITYVKDIQPAMAMVDHKEADASFILNPVQIQHMKAIALNGERMPPKTTYFYPKVLSGLTVYKME